MKSLLPVALLAALASAQEANPSHPAAAKLLADKKVCLQFARECGEYLLETKTGKPEVYSGDAGVALFLFHLHAATKEKRWRKAADKLLKSALAAESRGAGLYVGTAGVGQVCLDAWHATSDKKYLKSARECAEKLEDAAPYTSPDIISGAAGTGIFLLNLHAATGDEKFLLVARDAGDYIAGATVKKDGLASWPISPGRNPRVYIGLSHGAAGIGYFLLHLHRATGEKSYRELAEGAGRFVLRHAATDGPDGMKWTKIQPPLKPDAFPVQWCHGSPGIGLFFCDLERYVDAESFGPALDCCIASTRREGRTYRHGGCQCHGVSGNAELFVEAFRLRGDPALMDSARLFGSALVEPHENGFRVPNQVGRYRYPPGYMLGLAGIGQYFLRLADPENTPLPMMVREARKGG